MVLDEALNEILNETLNEALDVALDTYDRRSVTSASTMITRAPTMIVLPLYYH